MLSDYIMPKKLLYVSLLLAVIAALFATSAFFSSSQIRVEYEVDGREAMEVFWASDGAGYSQEQSKGV